MGKVIYILSVVQRYNAAISTGFADEVTTSAYSDYEKALDQYDMAKEIFNSPGAMIVQEDYYPSAMNNGTSDIYCEIKVVKGARTIICLNADYLN